ncbi:MAG: HigA family addiction module antitoxin [Thermodesulfobacteriota bacterium]
MLKDYLEPKGISQNYIARAIGVSPRAINQIVLCKRSITPKMSIRLGAFFGKADDFWHKIQIEYDFLCLEEERDCLVSSVKPFQAQVGADSTVFRDGSAMLREDVEKSPVRLFSDARIYSESLETDTKSDFNPRGAGDKAEVDSLRRGSSWHEARAAAERASAAEHEKIGGRSRGNVQFINHTALAAAWEAFASAVSQVKSEKETESLSLLAEAEVWEEYEYLDIANERRNEASKWDADKPIDSIQTMGSGAYIATLKQGKTYLEAVATKWKVIASEYKKSKYSEKAEKPSQLYIYHRVGAVGQKKYVAELRKGNSKRGSLILSWRAEATEYEKSGDNYGAALLRAKADKYEKDGDKEDPPVPGSEDFMGFFAAG